MDPSDEAFSSKEEFLRTAVKEKVVNPRFLEFFLGYREGFTTNKDYGY